MSIAWRGKKHCLLLIPYKGGKLVWDFQRSWGGHWCLRLRILGLGFNLYWDRFDFGMPVNAEASGRRDQARSVEGIVDYLPFRCIHGRGYGDPKTCPHCHEIAEALMMPVNIELSDRSANEC